MLCPLAGRHGMSLIVWCEWRFSSGIPAAQPKLWGFKPPQSTWNVLPPGALISPWFSLGFNGTRVRMIPAIPLPSGWNSSTRRSLLNSRKVLGISGCGSSSLCTSPALLHSNFRPVGLRARTALMLGSANKHPALRGYTMPGSRDRWKMQEYYGITPMQSEVTYL